MVVIKIYLHKTATTYPVSGATSQVRRVSRRQSANRRDGWQPVQSASRRVFNILSSCVSARRCRIMSAVRCRLKGPPPPIIDLRTMRWETATIRCRPA